MIHLDSETVGFTGPMVLLQWAENQGDINLHEVWNTPVKDTIQLIEYISSHEGGINGFNLVFDWFHVNKIYNILRVLHDNGHSGLPRIDQVIDIEATNPSEFCVKPVKALDLMLVARKGKFQYVMNRKAITIRRVPSDAAPVLAKLLKQHIDLPSICFANDPEGYRWQVKESTDHKTGKPIPGMSDIQLRFKGSTSLRALANAALKNEEKADWPIPKSMVPTEVSWQPYGQHGDRPWGLVIGRHIGTWQANDQARYYAWKDVDITRKLKEQVFPEEQGGDTDSELACAIGAARWRGFEINHSKIKELINQFASELEYAPSSPKACKIWLSKDLSPAEQMVLKDTKKTSLEVLEKHASTFEARRKATAILTVRKARYRIGLLKRLQGLPRFHPEFKVIGTKSNRQSGGGEGKKTKSINPQGIPRGIIRTAFTFARDLEVMHGGDANSYEVSIMAAVFPDQALVEDLLSGKKFHALMGEIWYGLSYDQMMYEASLGTGDTKYDKAKQGDFAMFYGAEEDKLSKVLGLDEVAPAMERFQQKYPELYYQRKELALQFCSMRQPGGIGSKVEWHEPADYIESVLGFRRYFTLENRVCKVLFTLANKPPSELKDHAAVKNLKVIRRAERGAQSIIGAIQSALFAAAFGLQAANMRAACNHVIQSPGGEITKELQLAFWKIQPVGVAKWVARTFNMHDEVIAVTDGSFDTEQVKESVMIKYRKYIPLLKWGWNKMNSWGDK